MKKFDRQTAFILLIAAITNALAILLIMPVKAAIGAVQSQKTTTLQVTVMDEMGNLLSGATIFIIETKQYYKTDLSGKTPIIEVPLINMEKYDDNSSEINIVTYLAGYNDCIFLGLKISKSRTSHATIKLSPYTGITSIISSAKT